MSAHMTKAWGGKKRVTEKRQHCRLAVVGLTRKTRKALLQVVKAKENKCYICKHF